MNDNTKIITVNAEGAETPKVMTPRELSWEADIQVAHAHDALMEYERSRASHATEEQKANEGRHGRAVLKHIDEAQKVLTQLRMRVNLQLEARDNARARQLDRILGIAEEPDGTWINREPEEDFTFQERVADLRAHDVERPEDVGGEQT